MFAANFYPKMMPSKEEYENMSIVQIEEAVLDLKTELQQLRQKFNANSAEPEELKAVKRKIRLGLTIRHQKILRDIVEQCKGKKNIPKQLRPRLTRAKREALTPKQLRKKVWRVRKHEMKYPRQCFSYDENK